MARSAAHLWSVSLSHHILCIGWTSFEKSPSHIVVEWCLTHLHLRSQISHFGTWRGGRMAITRGVACWEVLRTYQMFHLIDIYLLWHGWTSFEKSPSHIVGTWVLPHTFASVILYHSHIMFVAEIIHDSLSFYLSSYDQLSFVFFIWESWFSLVVVAAPTLEVPTPTVLIWDENHGIVVVCCLSW